MPILGWALAVILHVAWNGGLVLTSVQMDQDAGLLKLVAVQTAIVIVPAVLVLYAIARMSARHELRILREELRTEVERGTITQAEYAAIVDAEERQRALASAQARGGRALRRRQQAFFHTAADLALRNHHRHQGEPSRPRHAALDDIDRERLLALGASSPWTLFSAMTRTLTPTPPTSGYPALAQGEEHCWRVTGDP